ncbi:hypothetical protein KY362_04885 [Candidatus Woesearchaeota archaeon]|nr:hypothetical protein [Candidatus Woesearchaeota archaeon]
MNFLKILYVLIIVLLYIPMTFLGANVFFPEYTERYSYPYIECARPVMPVVYANITPEEQAAMDKANRECSEKSQAEEQAWREAKNNYEGQKYVAIALFNLLVLLIAVFVVLKDSITMGLFLGSVCTTFGATVKYFESKSPTGFVILVVTFFVMLWFVNKRANGKKVERKKK